MNKELEELWRSCCLPEYYFRVKNSEGDTMNLMSIKELIKRAYEIGKSEQPTNYLIEDCDNCFDICQNKYSNLCVTVWCNSNIDPEYPLDKPKAKKIAEAIVKLLEESNNDDNN